MVKPNVLDGPLTCTHVQAHSHECVRSHMLRKAVVTLTPRLLLSSYFLCIERRRKTLKSQKVVKFRSLLLWPYKQ